MPVKSSTTAPASQSPAKTKTATRTKSPTKTAAAAKSPTKAATNKATPSKPKKSTHSEEKTAQDRKVAWEEVRQLLPRKKTPEEKKERLALFKKIDKDGSKSLTREETYEGLIQYCHLDEFTTRLKDISKRAFNKAKTLGTDREGRGDKDQVEYLEFRMMLCYIYDYFELTVMFDEIDTSGNMMIDEQEFTDAVPMLADWGVKITDPVATFREIDSNGSGNMTFDEFANWAVSKKLDADGDPDNDEVGAIDRIDVEPKQASREIPISDAPSTHTFIRMPEDVRERRSQSRESRRSSSRNPREPTRTAPAAEQAAPAAEEPAAREVAPVAAPEPVKEETPKAGDDEHPNEEPAAADDTHPTEEPAAAEEPAAVDHDVQPEEPAHADVEPDVEPAAAAAPAEEKDDDGDDGMHPTEPAGKDEAPVATSRAAPAAAEAASTPKKTTAPTPKKTDKKEDSSKGDKKDEKKEKDKGGCCSVM